MPTDRLRSIVPMFGGGTSYVQALDRVLTFVETHHPTTDELVGWHRGTFSNVFSRDSIMRRVSYLEQVGFLKQIPKGGNLDAKVVSISNSRIQRPYYESCLNGTLDFEVCSMRCLRLR